MEHKLYTKVLEELEGAGADSRVLRIFYRALDHLVRGKQEKFARVLPLAEYLVDRWDKARLLGFGEGTSVYDSCHVLGDVKVGKDCWIGPFTILDGSGGGLTIGDRSTVSAGVQIYTHDTVARTLDEAAPPDRSPVRIGNQVYIGPQTVIARGVTIGDRVVIGANSLVLADVASDTKVAGSPARVLGRSSQ